MKLCFASNNKHKLEELQFALNGTNIEILSLKDLGFSEDIPETGETLEENAFQKAHHIFRKIEIPVIADDTGLEVEALNGRPGVYSARYAGMHCSPDDNMRKLLSEMQGKTNRNAAFKTIICFLSDTEKKFFKGEVQGEILHSQTGEKGFGYDPLFQPKGYNITFAEMATEEKNKISHRGIAIKKMVEYLKQKK